MAVTNFGQLSTEQKTYWMRDLWSYMRNQSFISKLMGKSENSCIQHITKLTKTEKGTRALMFLVAELTGRGVANDNEREGNEESMQEYEIDVNMGLISHQVRNKGKLSDQNHVIKFRETGRDRLKYWLQSAVDQMAFLTMSGITYQQTTQGEALGANAWSELVFADDVTAPSSGRHFRFDGTDLQAGATGSMTTGHVPKYGMLVDLKAYAKTSHMKPIMMNGKEHYIWVCDPRTLAALKQDSNFLSAITNAGPRGTAQNPFFTGSMVTIDGIVIMEHNLVYNTTKAVSGSAKWGSGADVDGTRSLFLGAQALGFVDVGAPDWVEKGFDYDSKQGISTDKFLGFRKPRFTNQYTGNADEDFGVIALDLAI
jgi:N4-gp56 family major capsid protein